MTRAILAEYFARKVGSKITRTVHLATPVDAEGLWGNKYTCEILGVQENVTRAGEPEHGSLVVVVNVTVQPMTGPTTHWAVAPTDYGDWWLDLSGARGLTDVWVDVLTHIDHLVSANVVEMANHD